MLEMLKGLLGGNQPQGGVMAPPGSPAMDITGGGGGFRDLLREAAPYIAMADPLGRNNAMGAAMMQSNRSRKEGAAKQEQANQTLSWLKSNGVGDQEAAYLASDPTALRAWFGEYQSGQKPDWKIQRILNDQGVEQDFMVDMRNPERMQPIGAQKAETEAPTSNMREYAEAQQQGFDGTLQDWILSQRKAGATNVTTNVGGESLTPGQKKIDEAFADTYLDWQAGGYADTAKQIEQLDESLGIIEKSASEGKPISGMIGALPDFVQPLINEQGMIAREGIEEVVQRSLREILGAQFTEKEGERLIARAYNPRLKPEENAKRVRRLLTQISSMAESRQEMVDYFDEHGTLRGYKGKRPSPSQINRLSDEFGASPDEHPEVQSKPISEMTDEELEALINGDR